PDDLPGVVNRGGDVERPSGTLWDARVQIDHLSRGVKERVARPADDLRGRGVERTRHAIAGAFASEIDHLAATVEKRVHGGVARDVGLADDLAAVVDRPSFAPVAAECAEARHRRSEERRV